MRAVRRGFPVLVSAWAHVGVIVALLALVGAPPAVAERGGAGAADLGGDDLGSATQAVEDDVDFGPPVVKLVSVGIVVDAVVSVPPVPVQSVVAQPIRDVKPVAAKKPASKPERVGLAHDGNAALAATATPDSPPVAEIAQAMPGVKLTQKGHKPSGKGKKEPCPVVANDGVEKLGDHAWSVERDVAEYYAGHIKELQKIASVRLVKNDEGKPDGFRVGVPRCSILGEGGLRSGDVVKTVNGIHVHDLFTAIGAYFKLRREDTIVLKVVRKGEKLTFRYQMV